MRKKSCSAVTVVQVFVRNTELKIKLKNETSVVGPYYYGVIH